MVTARPQACDVGDPHLTRGTELAVSGGAEAGHPRVPFFPIVMAKVRYGPRKARVLRQERTP